MARIGLSTGIDSERQRVYAAEDAWSKVLDRGGAVDFFGSRFIVPTQRILGDLRALRQTAQAWLSSQECRAWYPSCGPLEIRDRKGQMRAHYEPTAVIAIPVQSAWACRESVLAHEVAHHLSWSTHEVPHDRHFRLAMTRVAEIAFGPQAAVLLRASYDGAGLAVAHVD